MINWCIDYNGTLQVYCDNSILFEIADCKDMKEQDIYLLIKEQLKECE